MILDQNLPTRPRWQETRRKRAVYIRAQIINQVLLYPLSMSGFIDKETKLQCGSANSNL